MKNVFIGTSLVTQWLGLHIYTAGTEGSVLAQGTKMLQAVLGGQKKKPLLLFVIKMFGSCQAVRSIAPGVFLRGDSQVRCGGVTEARAL